VHPEPERAMSDGYQSLNFPQFKEVVERCRRVAQAVDREM
jgi:3-deoxy-7-phosphoheptulonate synthase